MTARQAETRWLLQAELLEAERQSGTSSSPSAPTSREADRMTDPLISTFAVLMLLGPTPEARPPWIAALG